MSNCCSHGTFFHFSLQSSHLNFCYYHQDLHCQLFHLGSCPKLCYDHRAFLLIKAFHHQDLLQYLFHFNLCPKLSHNCHTFLLIKAFHLLMPLLSFFSQWSFLKIPCECIRVVQYNIILFLNALPTQSQFYFIFDVIPMVFGITFFSPSLLGIFLNKFSCFFFFFLL